MSISCVYTISFEGCKKIYVGSTRNFKERVRCHKAILKSKRGAIRLQNAYTKYGCDAMKIEILEEWSSEFLLAFEQFWINELGAYSAEFGLNGRPIAEKCFAVKHSEKSKEKMRKKATGRKHSEATKLLLSRVTSARDQEVRQKMLASAKLRVRRPEEIERSRRQLLALKGVPKSPEHRAKLQAHLSRVAKQKTKLITFNGETKSYKEWAEKLGLTYDAIKKRVNKWPLEKALQPRTYKCRK